MEIFKISANSSNSYFFIKDKTINNTKNPAKIIEAEKVINNLSFLGNYSVPIAEAQLYQHLLPCAAHCFQKLGGCQVVPGAICGKDPATVFLHRAAAGDFPLRLGKIFDAVAGTQPQLPHRQIRIGTVCGRRRVHTQMHSAAVDPFKQLLRQFFFGDAAVHQLCGRRVLHRGIDHLNGLLHRGGSQGILGRKGLEPVCVEKG